MLYDHALHSISIFTMFHAFRCVFDCWKLCAARFGLGWTHNAISFSTSHVHAYFMHTYLFFSFFVLSCDYVLFVFSLSLSRINCIWHPSANLLQIGTLFHSGSSSSFDHPPLHVRFCDEKAQQDFFENFSKCGVLWYYSTQCHSHSGMRISMWDTLEVSYRDNTGVPLQYAWYQYLCNSVCYDSQRYTYCSHFGSCIRDTTCPAGSASWLPCLSVSKDYVQGWASVSLLWDTLHIRWVPKHLCLGFAKRSKIS